MRTLRFLLRKELLQIFRDRVMLAEIFVLPIVQLLLLSNAATFQVRSMPMAVVDDDRTPSSRGVVQALAASGRFVPARAPASMARADDALLRRDVGLVVRVPAGFERDVVRTHAAPVQLVLNAEDGAAAGISLAYAQRIVADYAATLGAPPHTPAPRPGVARLEVRTRGWYNPELDYRDYMVPGILVLLVTIVGTLLTAINIAREKEIGTLDQLNVTPITRTQFIAGKLLPLWAIGLVELSVGLLAAAFLFHVPIRGSVPLVFAMAAVYLLATLGLGLWISTLVETQQQAMFVTFFVLMVYLLMSGLFTPVRSMPTPVQWLAQLNPVMHFVEIVRAVVIKGAGLREIVRPFAVLVAYAAVVFGFAVRQYAKRVA